MAMTLAEGVTEARAILGEPAAVFFADAELESWLSQASLDVCAKTLGLRAIEQIYLPNNDLQTDLEIFATCALSGTPRVVEEQDVYFKVYPTKSAGAAPTGPTAWKSWDDTTLSGTPRRIGFRYDTGLYWTMGYPTATALNNPTADPDQDLFFDVPFAAVSGDPAVFCLETGGSNYYFTAYALPGTSVIDDVLLTPAPSGFLKALANQLTPDGSSGRGMPQIHPRQLGHLTAETGVDPRLWAEYANTLILTPGGGAGGITLALDCAQYSSDFTDLPDELQPLAVLYAVVLAYYKAGRFATGAHVYRQYLDSAMFMRRVLYPLTTEKKEDFMIPDKAVEVQTGQGKR